MTRGARTRTRLGGLALLLASLSGCVGPGLEPPARGGTGSGDGDGVFNNGGGAFGGGTGATTGTGGTPVDDQTGTGGMTAQDAGMDDPDAGM